MAITKPPVLPAWAESGDKVTPSNAEIQVGWPLSSIPPSRQRFNWLLNFLANGIRYFSRRGLPDYDAAETYMTGDRIIGDDGKTYRSLIDNNTAQTPSTSPTKWEPWALTQSQCDVRVQNNSAIAAAAGGTADAITATYAPAVTALTNGMSLYVRASSANATTTPTFKADGMAAKTIVKGNGLALAPGDIAGGGHWIELQYDLTLDKWVLLNPANGVAASGRLLNIKVFTGSGTYTPTPRTTSIIVEGVGGGGGGGGSAATGSSNISLGVGGSSGSYGKARFTSGFSGAVVTIGAAGNGSSGGSGGNGGTSSFGALMSCPGGLGGAAGGVAANTAVLIGNTTPPGSAPVGANLYGMRGNAGSYTTSNGQGTLNGGSGGSSPLGAGGAAVSSMSNGNSATGYGAAGGGSASGQSDVARAGGNGAPGVVIVYEYA